MFTIGRHRYQIPLNSNLSVRFFVSGTTVAHPIEHDENHEKETPRSGKLISQRTTDPLF